MKLLILIVLIALAVYFVADAVLLLRNKQFNVKRSRTWAILLAFLMLGLMIYKYISPEQMVEDSHGLDGREYFILGLIVLSSIYGLIDLIRAFMKKESFMKEATNPDEKCTTWAAFVRRKLTFFLFLVTLLIFYIDLKVF